MPLINCPTCSNPTSSFASQCPKCGHPINPSQPAGVQSAQPIVQVQAPKRPLFSVGGWMIFVLLLVGLGIFFMQSSFGRKTLESGMRLTDSSKIIGKWQQVDGLLSFEFFPDGTLLEVRPLNTGKGTYRILGDGRMHLSIEGALWGTSELDVKYEIDGDSFSITNSSGGFAPTLRYRRVK